MKVQLGTFQISEEARKALAKAIPDNKYPSATRDEVRTAALAQLQEWTEALVNEGLSMWPSKKIKEAATEKAEPEVSPTPGRSVIDSLQDCPRCGFRIQVYHEHPDGHFVQCRKCGGRGPVSATEHDAAVAWNGVTVKTIEGQDTNVMRDAPRNLSKVLAVLKALLKDPDDEDLQAAAQDAVKRYGS